MINPKLHQYVDRLTPDQDYLVREFVEYYEDGGRRRRDLLERVLHIAGSASAAAGLLLALGVKPAHADPLAAPDAAPHPQLAPRSPLSVAASDPAVLGGDLSFAARDGVPLLAYLARPNASGRFPAVMICQENQGLIEHFKDVARRFAKNGYVAIALDILSRQGGTEAVPMNMRGAGLTGPGVAEQQVRDFQDTMAYLRRQPYVIADRIGMTGYCLGGGVTFNVMAAEPTLRAAAPYYGFIMGGGESLRTTRAATLVVFGANDNLTSNIPAIEAALQAAGVPHRVNVYPDAPHAFFNDTRPSMPNNGYVESASLAAWRDTLDWFGTYLRVAGASALPATGDGSAVPTGGGDLPIAE